LDYKSACAIRANSAKSADLKQESKKDVKLKFEV